jgi:hypothetical protein
VNQWETCLWLRRLVSEKNCSGKYTESPKYSVYCIERSLDVWETRGTLARFVYAQAIGGPDSRIMRQSCEEAGPRRVK